MKKRTVYYTDEQNDDFATTHDKIHARKIDGKYRYSHEKSVFWKFGELLLYRLLATPIAAVYMYIGRGLRVRGRRNLRGLHGGYLLYGNHTQMGGDAFTPTMITFPKKANVLVHPDIVSIPVARVLVPFMGAVPVPSDMSAARHLLREMKHLLTDGQVITIYPEAHIWPYFNGIRNFTDASFSYPFLFDVPAVGFTVTYHKRKILRFLPPTVKVTIGKPIFPQECGNKTEMRNEVYNFMKETVKKEKSYAYVEYIKKEGESNEDHRSV